MNLYGNTSEGNLQIGTNSFTAGGTTQYFEWVGERGQDGGTWTWKIDRYGKVYMSLTSNASAKTVGRLRDEHWSRDDFPPEEPWFKAGSHGTFTYIDPNGKEFFCDWWIIEKN